MEAKISVCIHDSPQSSAAALSVVSSKQVSFTCPSVLKNAGFPVAQANFSCSSLWGNPTSGTLYKGMLSAEVGAFLQKRQNLVVFSYGIRSTPRRQLMYGEEGTSPVNGYAHSFIRDVISSAAGGGIFAVTCYVLGHSEYVTDLLNLDNKDGVIVESVKEGPRVRSIERARITSVGDVNEVFFKIIRSYNTVFADVLPQKQPTPELEAFPPFRGDTIFLQLHRYESEDHFASFNEANSVSFVALGDAERPVLCGVDAKQHTDYEKTQRVLLSAVGIISSIQCNRLRIPFGKSKLSQLLRRCYNSEKGYPYNSVNAPTRSILLVHCFSDEKYSEESYHCLSMTQRISSMLGSTGIGSILRDLSVEKWRMDQDVAELKDELLIAKEVYDYQPCIFESAKPIANIEEEEEKQIAAIQNKRDEMREKQLAVIRKRAEEEFLRLIKEQEAQSGTTLADLEKTLEAKKKETATLLQHRDERTKEYEKTLEKMRHKKEEEEKAAEALKNEIFTLEEELSRRQESIKAKQKQLNLSQLDKAKCLEAVQHERMSVQAVRKTVSETRRRQREQWVRQIKEINEKVREQVRSLAEERKRNGETSSKEEAAEKIIMDDIKAVEGYIPKLVSLEDIPVNPEEIEAIRRQFNEVFLKEKASYTEKFEEERARKEKLENGLQAYRNRVLEAAQERKKEKLQAAALKDHQVSALTDKVLTYLQSGVKMTKVSSQGNLRRRFFFFSDDCKRIHSCELDSRGFPISVKKPPITVWVKDIKKIIIGIYTPSFINYCNEDELKKARRETVTDNGTHRFVPTGVITPANLGLYNYRSFGLILKGGKSLELVCDSDSDCEAWLMVLKRTLQLKTEVEMNADKSNSSALLQSDYMQFGEALDIRRMNGFISLTPDEGSFCARNHIPPALFLKIKNEMAERSHTDIVTVYDLRNESGLDFIRSRSLYDFLLQQSVISASL